MKVVLQDAAGNELIQGEIPDFTQAPDFLFWKVETFKDYGEITDEGDNKGKRLYKPCFAFALVTPIAMAQTGNLTIDPATGKTVPI